MLEIKKNGSKNFTHYYLDFEYIGSDLYIDTTTTGSNVIITKPNGAFIFLKDGFNVTDITVFDVGGSAEYFTTTEALFSRLIALGYPAFTEDGDLDITGIDGNA